MVIDFIKNESIALVTGSGLTVGIASFHVKGWRFYPMTCARQPSRRHWPNWQACIPAWALRTIGPEGGGMPRRIWQDIGHNPAEVRAAEKIHPKAPAPKETTSEHAMDPLPAWPVGATLVCTRSASKFRKGDVCRVGIPPMNSPAGPQVFVEKPGHQAWAGTWLFNLDEKTT